MRIVTSSKYEADLGDHVFYTRKFRGVVERLSLPDSGVAVEVVEPPAATAGELGLAHTPEWISKVLEGRLSDWEEAMLEIPCSPAVAAAYQTAVGGTILACRHALEEGLGVHVGGGFHHAFADHGEGFCVFNDIAVGIRAMRNENGIRKAAVVDLDVHQGNGTATLFAGDPGVFTFSMHQENIYPAYKPPSSRDIELAPGTGDREYLRLLRSALPGILESHHPDLVVFQAGADPYEKDLLGSLKLTLDGFAQRDRAVFQECFRRRIPVVITLGGGYARNPADTVKIHAQTCRLGIRLHGDLWR